MLHQYVDHMYIYVFSSVSHPGEPPYGVYRIYSYLSPWGLYTKWD